MSTEEIDSYAQAAHTLVDNVIDSAIKRLETEDLQRQEALDSIKFNLSTDERFIYQEPKLEDFEVRNIKWLMIGEFSPEKAEEKIHEFIKTWEYQDSWEYCIDYLGANEHQFDVRHRYRVRWSIPTRRKPVPRATACVYFTFDVSKIKPKSYPVDIFYVFETNSLVHRPGFSRFREKWLKDIIESKVIMMEAIDF